MSEDIEKRILEYEGLIVATTRYWREHITTDLSDDDIEQELRIKVWRALESFDPSRGYPENKHVFGVVRNRVKDLIKRKKIEYSETQVWSMDFDGSKPSEDLMRNYGMSEAFRKNSPMLNWMIQHRVVPEKSSTSDLLIGLDKDEQQIAVMIARGYTPLEIHKHMGVTLNYVRTRVARIKKHIAAAVALREQSQRNDRD